MRTNKERVKTLLGVILPQFLKELMKRAKAELKDGVKIIHQNNCLQILFDFAVIKYLPQLPQTLTYALLIPIMSYSII